VSYVSVRRKREKRVKFPHISRETVEEQEKDKG